MFSGDRFDIFVRKIDTTIKNYIFEQYPELQEDLRANILLSYCIYGGFHAYQDNKNKTSEEVIATLAKASAEVSKLISQSELFVLPE